MILSFLSEATMRLRSPPEKMIGFICGSSVVMTLSTEFFAFSVTFDRNEAPHWIPDHTISALMGAPVENSLEGSATLVTRNALRDTKKD